MTNPVMLNFETHKNTKIITTRGKEFGENIHFVPVLADELSALVLEYPICLMKDPETGQFGLYALLGFEPGENFYLKGDDWNANYIPLHVRRQPFIIGFADDSEEAKKNAIIAIDMDSKRVQESEGEALFNADGSKTEFLEGITKLLSQLITGMESTKAFVSMLAENDLIEGARIDIALESSEKKSYDGIYTVNQDKLLGIKGDLLEVLHSKSYLHACHLIMASVGNIRKLINRKNETI